MTATFYNRGRGHSRNGEVARDMGAMAWSKLPAALRRNLKSADAQTLRISDEWHHAGKYANEVYVYYPAQVEAFWAVLDAAGVSVREALDAVTVLEKAALGCADAEAREAALMVWQPVRGAQAAAEQARLNIIYGD